MLENVDADSFLLPFDIREPQHTEVLSHLPKGKRVILGLVDGSISGLENVDDIVETVKAASRYVDPAYISISPTCGFKVRNRESQGLNYETQWAKINLLEEAAEKLRTQE